MDIPEITSTHVYKIDGCSWFATKWSLEDTIEWCKKEIGLEPFEIDLIEECDITAEGLFWETDDPEDIDALGDNDEILSGSRPGGSKYSFGDIIRRYGSILIYKSFEDVLKIVGNFNEPFEIASTEW